MTDILERPTAALSGRYRIERELGAGGMATVFLAEDQKHDRRVAIKVPKPESTAVLGGDRDGADQATVLAARLQLEPRLTVLGIDTVAQLPKPIRAWDLDPVSGDFVASQSEVRQRGFVVVVNWLDALRGLPR